MSYWSRSPGQWLILWFLCSSEGDIAAAVHSVFWKLSVRQIQIQCRTDSVYRFGTSPMGLHLHVCTGNGWGSHSGSQCFSHILLLLGNLILPGLNQSMEENGHFNIKSGLKSSCSIYLKLLDSSNGRLHYHFDVDEIVFSNRWGVKGEISITRQLELFKSLASGISHITLANLVFLISAARCFFFHIFLPKCIWEFRISNNTLKISSPPLVTAWSLGCCSAGAQVSCQLMPIQYHARLCLEHSTGQVWGFFPIEKSDHLRIALSFMLPCPVSDKGCLWS